MDDLLKAHLEEARSALIEQIRAEATVAGIAKVKEKIEMERVFREHGEEIHSLLFYQKMFSALGHIGRISFQYSSQM